MKKRLASIIVAEFHSEEEAKKAEEEFERVFAKKEAPKDLPVFEAVAGEIWLPGFLRDNKVVPSSSEARRLIKQGAIDINGEKVKEEKLNLTPGEYVLRIGKKKFIKLLVKG